ncbi:MAG: homoserine dehydrogenase [Betaproteobacteria bacterium]
MSVELDLVLVGFGNVARRFVTLLDEQRSVLEEAHNLRTRVVAMTTRRHGSAVDPHGLDAAALADVVRRGGTIEGRRGGHVGHSTGFLRRLLATDRFARLAHAGRLVVIETTTLDIESGRPAIDHVRAALAGGAHVVTANKGPAAFAYRSLAAAAARAGRRFLFEGAVMDGIPVFNLVRETLPTVRVTGFRGVVNATTNYILTSIERGQTFGEALAAMQAAGVAEADPSLDVKGWDAAAKASVLANVLLDARMTPRRIEREGIDEGTGLRVAAARARGRRVKLVVRGERDARGVRARVRLEDLPSGDLLAELEGEQNALVLNTDLLGEIAIVQRGSGLTQTAYALLSDLVAVSRHPAGRPQRSRPRARRGRSQ